MGKRLAALVSVIGLFGIAFGSTAEARKCYPKCAAGDGTVTAIMTPGTLQKKAPNPVTVDGANIGNKGAKIGVSLKTKIAGKKASRNRTALSVAAGDPFTVVLNSRPKKAGTATLTACAKARKDANNSNNCASASVPVA